MRRQLPTLLLAVWAGCTADPVRYEGRPCSPTDPCGGETVCDPAQGVCVARPAGDGSLDLPSGGEASPPPDWRPPGSDGAPDQRPPDRGLSDRGAPDTLVAVPDVHAWDKTPVSDSCTPSCSGKLCGASDGCGGTCAAGSGCCTPSCSGKLCGASDGCGGTCAAGSGCTVCPTTCQDVGMLSASEVTSCAFTGSTCACPGVDANSNNQCDSGESCWGTNNCPKNSSTLCTTKMNPVPAGCPSIGYCFQC